MYEAEARFLRGLAYATLVESYGGVPIIWMQFQQKMQGQSQEILQKKPGTRQFLTTILQLLTSMLMPLRWAERPKAQQWQ
jgi:hypothetical protein